MQQITFFSVLNELNSPCISFPDNYGDCRTGTSTLNHHTGASVNNGHASLSILGHGATGGSSSSSPALVTYSNLYTSTSAQPLQHVTSPLQYHHPSHFHHQGGGGGGSTGVSSPPLNHYYDLIQHHMNNSSSQHVTTTIPPPKVECPSPPAELQGNRSSHSPGEAGLGASPHIVTLGNNNNNNNKVVVMGSGDNNMDRPTVVSMSS
jgi:hypothetical protein